jgi:hypothetical protein
MMQFPEKNSALEAKKLKFAFRELLIKNLPKGSFPAKILHSITFERHNRFIQTVTQLMQLSKRIMTQSKNFKTFNLREQFSRKLPQREFPSQKTKCVNNF